MLPLAIDNLVLEYRITSVDVDDQVVVQLLTLKV